MGLVNIENSRIKLIMVGGKGGVGKTTCASAVALKLAMDGKKSLSFPATRRHRSQTFLKRRLATGKQKSAIATNYTR